MDRTLTEDGEGGERTGRRTRTDGRLCVVVLVEDWWQVGIAVRNETGSVDAGKDVALGRKRDG